MDSFLQDALAEAGLALTAHSDLHLATGCSGSGSPSWVLRALLRGRVKELFGAESSKSKAHFFITHLKPEHCFADLRDVACGGRAPCFVHAGRMCDVPKTRPDLMCIGFVCKSNSVQNPRRFEKDNVKPEGADNNMDTYYAARRAIVLLGPRIVVLENVRGIMLRRGGSETDSTLSFVESDPTWGLATIPGYSYARITVTGWDGTLPTPRERVWFILVADDVGHAANVVKNIENLVARFKRRALVHMLDFRLDEASSLRTMWPAHPHVSEGDPSDTVATEQRRAAYGQQMGAIFGKVTQHGMLPPGWQLTHPAERVSAALDPEIRMPAFTRACVDVHGDVVKHMGSTMACADVSQSAGRSKPRSDGTAPTLTTVSRLVVYEQDDDFPIGERQKVAFLNPHELLALHGFDPRKLNLVAMSWSEAVAMAGDGMCLTSVALVLIPCLQELGFLAAVPWEAGPSAGVA